MFISIIIRCTRTQIWVRRRIAIFVFIGNFFSYNFLVSFKKYNVVFFVTPVNDLKKNWLGERTKNLLNLRR